MPVQQHARVISAQTSSDSRVPGTRTQRNRRLPTIAEIFQFQQWKLTKYDKIPPVLDHIPLTVFYHTDQQLATAVKALSKIRYGQLRHFRKAVERVHRLQKEMLNTIYGIYCLMPEDIKADRDYRLLLPYDDQQELQACFSENILFAAEALARGFRIRGVEAYADVLRSPAVQLCAAIEAVRFVFCMNALRNPMIQESNMDQIKNVLRDFDLAWTEFEHRICFCYFAVSANTNRQGIQQARKRLSLSEESDLFTVLLSETVLRSLKLKYFTREEMKRFEPFLMFAIPRLSVVASLLHSPDYLNLSSEHVGFRWLSDCEGRKVDRLCKLRKALLDLNTQEVETLERMLLNKEEQEITQSNSLLGNPNDEECEVNLMDVQKPKQLLTVYEVQEPMKEEIPELVTLQDLYRIVSAVADELQTGPNARQFVQILSRVFRMYVNENETDHVSSFTLKAQSTPPESRIEIIRYWIKFWRRKPRSLTVASASSESSTQSEQGLQNSYVESTTVRFSIPSISNLLASLRLL